MRDLLRKECVNHVLEVLLERDGRDTGLLKFVRTVRSIPEAGNEDAVAEIRCERQLPFGPKRDIHLRMRMLPRW
jgi:hypothetical protein